MKYEYLTLGIKHAQGLAEELKARVPLERLSWSRTRTSGDKKDLEDTISNILVKDVKIDDYLIDTYNIYDSKEQIGTLEVHTYYLKGMERCLKVEYKGSMPGFKPFTGNKVHLLATERENPDSSLIRFEQYSKENNTQYNPIFRQDDTPIKLGDYEKLPRSFPSYRRKYTDPKLFPPKQNSRLNLSTF